MRCFALFISIFLITNFPLSAPLASPTTNNDSCADEYRPQPGLSGGGPLFKAYRASSPLFWSTHKTYAPPPELVEAFQIAGIIIGDFHPGNVNVMAIPQKTGASKMQAVVNDFDDVSNAPMLFDLLRTLCGFGAIERDHLNRTVGLLIRPTNLIFRREFVTAYVKGLSGIKMELPDRFQSAIEKGTDYYYEERDQWVDDTSHGGVDPRWKENEEFKPVRNKTELLAEAQSLLPEFKLHDVVSTKKTTGGSANLERFLFLASPAREKKPLCAIEFKQWRAPAPDVFYDLPPQPGRYLSQFFDLYFPGANASQMLNLVDFKAGTGHLEKFKVREKIKILVEIPYDLEEAEDVQFMESLGVYMANYLGYYHGLQKEGPKLKALLNSEDIQSKLTQVMIDAESKFLDTLEENLRSNSP